MRVCMHLNALHCAALKRVVHAAPFFRAGQMQYAGVNCIQKEPFVFGCHMLGMRSHTHPSISGVNEPY